MHYTPPADVATPPWRTTCLVGLAEVLSKPTGYLFPERERHWLQSSTVLHQAREILFRRRRREVAALVLEERDQMVTLRRKAILMSASHGIWSQVLTELDTVTCQIPHLTPTERDVEG